MTDVNWVNGSMGTVLGWYIMLPNKNDENINRKSSKPQTLNDVFQYFQEIQSKSGVPQITKIRRHIFKKDHSCLVLPRYVRWTKCSCVI